MKAPDPDSVRRGRRWWLHRPGQALFGGAEDGIELVPVRFAEDKHIDIPYRTLVGLFLRSGRSMIRRCNPR